MIGDAPTIAVTSTRAMVGAAEAAGVDVDAVLDEAGLGRALLDDPDGRLPGPVVHRLWDVLRERSSDPSLQLRAPLLLPYGAYRVVDYLALATPTLGEWIRLFARYFRLINTGVDVTVEEGEEDPWLELQMQDAGPVPPVYVDYTLAALIGRTRMHAYPNWRPSLVELRHPAPTDEAPYREILSPRVVFGADRDRFVCRRADWGMRSASGDADLGQVLEEHARALSAAISTKPGFELSVRKSIMEVLQDGASAEAVAQRMNMSVRTLQRRLSEQKTTFSRVLDDVRVDLAKRYLSSPDVAITEVAFLLGFSEQSSFHRAYRRWTGVAPGEWRRNRPEPH